MIKQLRRKFIKIAMIAVTAVMVTLCLIVNIAHFVSANSDSNRLIEMIYNNEGTMPKEPDSAEPNKENSQNDTAVNQSAPQPKDKPNNSKFGGPVDKETPYTTRFFVLKYKSDGTLTFSNFKSIAAVSENDSDKYLSVALKRGEGRGYYGGYKYNTSKSDDEYMTIFLDCHTELRSSLTLALLSFGAVAVCLVLVYIIVVLLSRKAIDPVVKAHERQKQFITDAGHELKTPITVIATGLKVLELETGKNKWIDKSYAQTEKLTKLVNSLVTLSKMDEESSPLVKKDFDVSAAAEETAGSFCDFAKANGLKLLITIENGVQYRGDEYAVRQLISILIDNAVKYAVADSPIEFSLKKAKKGIIISCKNRSENIDKDELPKLFDRFYRADKSRTESGSGFGIGLSIARSIAEGHDGTIKAENEGDDIICFTAHLR